MIICELQGRLGNKLFQVFATIAAAIQSEQPFGFYDAIDSDASWKTLFQPIASHVLSRVLKHQYRYEETNFHYIPFAQALVSPTNKVYLIKGYFQSFKYFQEHEDRIKAVLGVEELQDQVRSRVLQDMPFVKDFKTTVSLHFRLGDYVQKQDMHPVMPLQYYLDALEIILRRDPSVQQVMYFCEAADVQTVMPMIEELSKLFHEIEFYKAPSGLSDVDEMLTMSLCKHRVIANSTFSWWGAYLGTASGIVCYPSMWFGPTFEDKDVRDMFPSTWVKVEVDKKVGITSKSSMKTKVRAQSKYGYIKPPHTMTAHESPSLVSMVWSGGKDWLNSKAQIVALATALPAGLSSFSPWNNCCSPPTPAQAKTIQGTLILSVGGSNSDDGGWSDMAAGGVNAWLTYFKNLFLSTGINGIDWDIENINVTNTAVYNFIGQLSQLLRAMGALVTFTIFGNDKNAWFPPASFLSTYGSSCDYIVFMLYNGGMWTENNWKSWCDHLQETLPFIPQSMMSKFLYAVYPTGGQPCCAPCIQQAVDNIRGGKGAGVAFWCYGGWLGSCNSAESQKIVEAWVEILNAGGGNGASDYQVAYPLCKGDTATDGCGRTSPSTMYSCSGSTCQVSTTCTGTTAGCYDTNTCNSSCSVPNQNYFCTGTSCVTSDCALDTFGCYSSYTACMQKCGSPAMYACTGSTCSKSNCEAGSTGCYSTSTECGNSCPPQPSYACSSLGLSVPTGGACSDPSAQFSCNGQTRCCCLDYAPSPSATNPTSCVSKTAAARFYRR